MQPMPGMQPLTLPGVTWPLGPPGIDPSTRPGVAVPVGPPGMAPLAPSGVTILQGVPSALKQSVGSAAAGAAHASAAAAAPATAKVIAVLFMCSLSPPAARQAKGLVKRGGSNLSMATSGTQGHPGTMARPFSASMALTILATPVALSTISVVLAVLAVISDSM